MKKLIILSLISCFIGGVSAQGLFRSLQGPFRIENQMNREINKKLREVQIVSNRAKVYIWKDAKKQEKFRIKHYEAVTNLEEAKRIIEKSTQKAKWSSDNSTTSHRNTKKKHIKK